MRRRTAVIALFVLAALVIPDTAMPAVTGEIKAMSHKHPKGKSFSWVAARIDATEGAHVSAHLMGPGVASKETVDCNAPRSTNGKVLIVWKITSLGTYTVHLTTTKNDDSDSDSKSYKVTRRPRVGPFKFPTGAGCKDGWPT